MASEEDHTVSSEEDLDEDEEEESEDHDHLSRNDAIIMDDDDEDVDDDYSTSSSNLATADGEPPPPPFSSSAAGEVTIAVSGVPNALVDSYPDQKRQRIDDVSISTVVVEAKKPLHIDDSRKLFQRLWTDEDEIELLQGFLEYTTQRGTNNSSHHYDTTAFYDQIKSKLQLDFNKNQLVEKLRRLKKKYRNVLNKTGSGKVYAFKSPHDQTTFEISRKIWSGSPTVQGGGATIHGGSEEGGLDDEDSNPNRNPNTNLNDHNNYVVDLNSSQKKVPIPRKRSRGVKIEEKQSNQSVGVSTATPSIPSLIEDTVRSCLSPLFKELLHNANSRGFGLTLGPTPLHFGGLTGGDAAVDERWRKQQILELEVYSKRLELVQDQIKTQLEELRLMGN